MTLKAIMYHYVRNPEATIYKGINSVREEEFIAQVRYLSNRFEMASPEAIMAFLSGEYKPRKDLCVLTFDDGIKEHAYFVTSVLQNLQIRGQFFIPTACINDGFVLPVHKNHFLLASLDFKYYKQTFLAVLSLHYPDIPLAVDVRKAAETYRWDKKEVAGFKYLLNYTLPRSVRNHILKLVFETQLGPEETFAKELYLSWEEIRLMRDKGMVIGGHSHQHNILASLNEAEQTADLRTCMQLLRKNVQLNDYWFFSYPFGKLDTFNQVTIDCLKAQGVSCAYSTIVGQSAAGSDPFLIKRVDPKDIVLV